jgi:hypothetical protein
LLTVSVRTAVVVAYWAPSCGLNVTDSDLIPTSSFVPAAGE